MAKMLLRFNSLYDFRKAFPTELSCIRFLENKRWPNGVVSPYDPTSKIYKYKQVGRYTCKNTGKDFNVRTGTIFQDTKIPLRKWFLVIFLVITCPKGVSAYKIQKDIAVSYKTAWFLLHRIREALVYNCGKLSGEVELDETFVGGQNKRRHDKLKCYKSGRSAEDKKPILGMLQRSGGHKKVRCFVTKDTTKQSLQKHITTENIEAGTELNTDSWKGYSGLTKKFKRVKVDHGKHKYVSDNGKHTNTIEGFWGNYCKRAIYGCYNFIKASHMHRYFDEFSFRYNHSKVSENERFSIFFDNIEHRLTYKTLINEHKDRNLKPLAKVVKEQKEWWEEEQEKKKKEKEEKKAKRHQYYLNRKKKLEDEKQASIQAAFQAGMQAAQSGNTSVG